MKILFDNNLPKHIAKGLNHISSRFGLEVRHLQELFPADTDDVTIINHLAGEGDWAFITFDHAIRKNVEERLAWQETGLLIFWFVKSWQNIDQQTFCWKLLKVWPSIFDAATKRRGRNQIIGYRIKITSPKLEELSL